MESGGGVSIETDRDRRRLDQLFDELVATRLAFDRTADADEKARLSERLTELRRQVADLPMAGLSGLDDRELERRIQGLRSRIDGIYERRLSPAFCGFSNEAGGSIDPVTWFEMTGLVDRETGLAALEHELRMLLDELETRRALP
ncbi:MAG TPA: hypothetical protein ENI86_01470 [Acidimicrobiales bacterium]|nr:hypothetical protein [Acidimicrobiales bacterium]